MDHRRQGESNDPRKGNPRYQETNQDDLYCRWYKLEQYPSFSPPSQMTESNQFSFPAAALSPPENCLPTFPQIPINPYHPIPKTTFPNGAYDPSTLEIDFSHLNLSTPSRNSQGLGFDRSFHQIPSDFSLNSQLDYSNHMNLQRMRVESAVRGQTGVYADPYGFLGLREEPLESFRTTRLSSNGQYGNYSASNGQYGNYSAYGIGGLNRFSSRVNENGFYEADGYGHGAPTGSRNRNGSSSAYDNIGYGASATTSSRNGFPSAYGTGYLAGSNASSRKGFQSVYGSGYGVASSTSRNGSRVDNGLHRRGRSGTGARPERSSSGGSRSPELSSLSERLNARPFEQWRGNIVFLAKDQHGYAFLKKKIEEKKEEDIELIFSEVKDHVRELMVDQYGNYPIQKIFEVCNEDQMTQMLLLVVSEEHYLMSICVDTHGTRAMQKMLEYLTTPEQVSLAMSVISRITLVLTKSMSGYRVIERCLKSFTNDQNRQLLYVIAENCADIAMDQAGCCVLQQCVIHAEGEAQERLTRGIIANTLVLSENIYGNYVVQYILGLQVPQFIEQIMAQLAGSYVSLSMNKYGSNVVERCIRDSNEEQAARIIREIYDSPNFLMVLQDPFGNYVTQTALEIAKGGLRHAILTLIQHHHPYLHSHPHGKRVIAKLRGNGKHHRGYEFRR